MLCLTVRKDARVYIGDIEVVVTEICGNRVRLGIQAPASVRIVREELADQKREDAA